MMHVTQTQRLAKELADVKNAKKAAEVRMLASIYSQP
jgi:hypothetical protein